MSALCFDCFDESWFGGTPFAEFGGSNQSFVFVHKRCGRVLDLVKKVRGNIFRSGKKR